MKTYFKIICLIFFVLTLVPFLTKAITFGPPFETKSFEELIDAIINFIFLVAIVIVPIMILIAAFYFLTSGGNSEKVNTAKKIILFTFIGLFIVLLGKGIVAIIKQVLGGGGPAETCADYGGSCDHAPDCAAPWHCLCSGCLDCTEMGALCCCVP